MMRGAHGHLAALVLCVTRQAGARGRSPRRDRKRRRRRPSRARSKRLAPRVRARRISGASTWMCRQPGSSGSTAATRGRLQLQCCPAVSRAPAKCEVASTTGGKAEVGEALKRREARASTERMAPAAEMSKLMHDETSVWCTPAAAARATGGGALVRPTAPTAPPVPRCSTSQMSTPKSRRLLSSPTASWLVCTGFHAIEKHVRCDWGTNSQRALMGASVPAPLRCTGAQSCSTTFPAAVPTASVHGWSCLGHHDAHRSCCRPLTLLTSCMLRPGRAAPSEPASSSREPASRSS